jgi:hypothetical protein
MKRALFLILLLAAFRADSADLIGTAAENYFAGLFAKLENAAAQKPTVESFRDVMKPVAESVSGFYDATLIDTHYVIRQTYLKRNVIARGFNLRNVRPLDDFWKAMDEHPAAQLSEPGHGTILQPRLISMRVPFFTDGNLAGIVSMMIRTEDFLAAVKLDQCPAYQIICRGEPAEEKGSLSAHCCEVKLSLPSTEWVIRYDP